MKIFVLANLAIYGNLWNRLEITDLSCNNKSREFYGFPTDFLSVPVTGNAKRILLYEELSSEKERPDELRN